MKSLSINLLHIVLVVAALVAIGAYMFLYQPKQVSGSVYDATRIGTATTSAAVAVAGTNTRLLATTTNALGDGSSYTRVFASICSTSATPVVINLDGDKPASASAGQVTAVIAAAAGYSTCYEITERNLYMGSVTASSTAGSVTVYVKDYVQ